MDDLDKIRNEQRRALNSRDFRIQVHKDKSHCYIGLETAEHRARDKQKQAAELAREMAEHFERQLKDAGVKDD